jgi:hypothetical protein
VLLPSSGTEIIAVSCLFQSTSSTPASRTSGAFSGGSSPQSPWPPNGLWKACGVGASELRECYRVAQCRSVCSPSACMPLRVQRPETWSSLLFLPWLGWSLGANRSRPGLSVYAGTKGSTSFCDHRAGEALYGKGVNYSTYRSRMNDSRVSLLAGVLLPVLLSCCPTWTSHTRWL